MGVSSTIILMSFLALFLSMGTLQVSSEDNEIKVVSSPSQSPSPSQVPLPKSQPPSHAPSPKSHAKTPSHAPSPKPHAKTPSHAPSPKSHAKIPSHAPSPKSPAPSQAPSPKAPSPQPTRQLVAVQGVVFCKPCKYRGVPTLLGASPLAGAVVRLQCNNTRIPLIENAITDKNGYFFLHAKNKISNFGIHKCKAFLVFSPSHSCNKPTDLHSGQSGAILRYEAPKKPTPFAIYTVGPFAFEPSTCPR